MEVGSRENPYSPFKIKEAGVGIQEAGEKQFASPRPRLHFHFLLLSCVELSRSFFLWAFHFLHPARFYAEQFGPLPKLWGVIVPIGGGE